MNSKLEVRIYYRDTDCGGVVYYANYLEYFERGRTAYMEERGVDIGREASSGISFAVKSASVKYISPAKYGDTLIVETRLEALRGASLVFSYSISKKGTGDVIAEGNTLLACIDSRLRPRRIPEEIFSSLSRD